MEKMETGKCIYPDVKVDTALMKKGGEWIEDTHIIVLETFIRKKYRRKYYLQRVWNKYYIPVQENIPAAVAHSVCGFHMNVYRAMILGKVNMNIEYPDHLEPAGRKMFELDPDQTSEEERLKI